MTRERDSNMELLRIIAMLSIVLYHGILHSYLGYGEYMQQYPIFAFLKFILHFGVPAFVLISGFYGIKPSIKGFIQLYAIVVFYNLLTYFIFVVINDSPIDVVSIERLFRPISAQSNNLWFVQVYMLLYLCSPILNGAIIWIRQNSTWRWVLTSVVFIIFYLTCFRRLSGFEDGGNILNFCSLYLIGAWLHDIVSKYDIVKMRRVCSLGLCLLVLGYLAVIYYSEIGFHTKTLKWFYWFAFHYNGPIMYLLACLIVLLFSTFKIQSRVVNWIAAGTFSVYLIHENTFSIYYRFYDIVNTNAAKPNLCALIMVGGG